MPEPSQTIEDLSAATSFGGVVFDNDGRVLLRTPTNFFGGYVWTFAKGRPDGCETPEQTALRETVEETGVVAEVVTQLPKLYRGTNGWSAFFLMTKKAESGVFDSETSAIGWFDLPEAFKLLHLTTNQIGYRRDVAVLECATRLHESRTHLGFRKF